jgi:hypothetical protein
MACVHILNQIKAMFFFPFFYFSIIIINIKKTMTRKKKSKNIYIRLDRLVRHINRSYFKIIIQLTSKSLF